MFKPLIPIFTDAWEHAFNEIEHLTLVHEKFGSHHLEKELADNGHHDDDHDKNPNTLKTQDQVPFHVLAGEYKSAFIYAFDAHSAQHTSSELPFIFIAREGPPPKFI